MFQHGQHFVPGLEGRNLFPRGGRWLVLFVVSRSRSAASPSWQGWQFGFLKGRHLPSSWTAFWPWFESRLSSQNSVLARFFNAGARLTLPDTPPSPPTFPFQSLLPGDPPSLAGFFPPILLLKARGGLSDFPCCFHDTLRTVPLS